MLPIFKSFKTPDTAIAITTASVSVSCMISMVNTLCNEWEAYNSSHVSAFSQVHDKSERSSMEEDPVFWPYAELTCFR